MTRRLEEVWRRRARRALFGTEAITRRVILTPFASVLDAVPGTERGGWWRVRCGGALTVIHVPQGSAVADAVLALAPGHEITFVGLCGTTDTGTRTGSIVDATRAIAFDGTVGKRNWASASRASSVTLHTVRNLADSTTRHRDLAAPGTCVDLESAWVLAASRVASCQARALLAVSDNNQDGAVFASDSAQVALWLEEALSHARRHW